MLKILQYALNNLGLNNKDRKLADKIYSEDVVDDDAAVLERLRTIFDVDFYLEENPDVLTSGADPLNHYHRHGWMEGRNPSPSFSTRAYQIDYPDVAAAGINPLWHYIEYGRAEGRKPKAACHTPLESSPILNPIDVELEKSVICQEFDVGFYLGMNPDVEKAKIDPITHFIVCGWREGRNPNRHFSISYYLQSNPDVVEAGINPFWHYIVAGREEGRLTEHPGGFAAQVLGNTIPLEDMVESWLKPGPENLLRMSEIISTVVQHISSDTRGLAISFSHDNYREIGGGVQFCLQQEESIAVERGMVYLNVNPYQPLPRMSAASGNNFVILLINGRSVGPASMVDFIEALRSISARFEEKVVIVHHLLGHAPELICEVIKAVGLKHCWLWLHDSFTICTSHGLQRNNVSYCGAPPPNSNACTLCLYGAERISQLDRIGTFFNDISVHVISPSVFMAEFWEERTKFKGASLAVCEHAQIEWALGSQEHSDHDISVPITVAFSGYATHTKGWPVYKKIVEEHAGCVDFRFLYFGMSNVLDCDIKKIPVSVSSEAPDDMIDAIAVENVDIVIHWASCPETFSFSAYEAIAAGAYVITNSKSGNVAAVVKRLNAGVILDDPEDLLNFFRDGRVQRMVSTLRGRRSAEMPRLVRSSMTFSVIE